MEEHEVEDTSTKNPTSNDTITLHIKIQFGISEISKAINFILGNEA